MDFLNSETRKNLVRSFAGESQARTRYTVYAGVARKENFEWIARIFEETAANETVHAEEFLEMLKRLGGCAENVDLSAGYPFQLGTTAENLAFAANGEKDEHDDVYPGFAEMARREGYNDAARLWMQIARIEGVHHNQFQSLEQQLTKGELTEKLHSISYRATKAECLDLPETTDVIRQIELEPAALRIYRGLVKESYAELAGGEVTATNILTRLLRLSQLTGGFLGNDETAAVEQVSAAKLSALEDILDGAMAEGKKLVIIARFIPEIRAICKLLEKRGLGYSCITGEVKNRDEQVARFQKKPEVMAFVGQIATAGLGITLTAASTMVFYSLDYSMSNFEQTKARIHRVGQRMPCTYLYLVARGTVDEKVLAALESKADLARTLVDDYRSGRNPFAA